MSPFESWALILGLWANALAWWLYFDGRPTR